MFSLSPVDSLAFEVEPLPNSAVSLGGEDFQRALAWSEPLTSEARQWDLYASALALAALQHWLAEFGDLEAALAPDCPLPHPDRADALPQVARLTAGPWELCAIVLDAAAGDRVAIPRAAVDLPGYAAQFYVLVSLHEEIDRAAVVGCLRRDRLLAQLAATDLAPEPDWTYPVPLSWFEFDPDRLLLYLQCADPATLPLPAPTAERSASLAAVADDLRALLPQFAGSDRPLWDGLSWDQGAVVLCQPDLLRWTFQLRQDGSVPAAAAPGDVAPEAAPALGHLLDWLAEPAIDAGRWLRSGLDDLARELQWAFMPDPSPAGAFRSAVAAPAAGPSADFAAIARQLQQQGIEIPPEARGARRQAILAGQSLNVFLVVWQHPQPTPDDWWSLLVVTGGAIDRLPEVLTLRIDDASGALVDDRLDPRREDGWPFACVSGGRGERFRVELQCGDAILTLPLLGFDLD